MFRFINRLRQKEALGTLRYFYVGEYGDKTQRPHYHLALFGQPSEIAAPACEKLWRDSKGSIGFVHTGDITKESIAYIAGYCTKKMGKDDVRLQGRYPEFNRRSRKPPLGKPGIDALVDTLYTRRGAALLSEKGDVPHEFRVEGKTYPITAYWRERMREALEITDPPKWEPWALDLTGFLQELRHAEEKTQQLERRERARQGRRTL